MTFDKDILDKLSRGIMPIQFRMGLDAEVLSAYLAVLGLTEFVPAKLRK